MSVTVNERLRAVSGMRDRALEGAMVWDRQTQLPADANVTLSPACLTELQHAGADLEANPLPMVMVSPDQFEMPACRAFAAHCKRTLDDGVGFVVLDEFPIDAVDKELTHKLFWLLLSMIARPVSQNITGTMLWHVADTGKRPAPGNGVRASQSSLGQEYHTDNNCGVPPEYVALLCFHPAMRGGESGLISFDSVYNRLLAERPEALPRTYQPFFYDRQRDYLPGDEPVLSAPIFTYDGNVLKTRFCPFQIRQGYALAGIEADGETEAAIDALTDVMAAPELGKTFDFAPGQIQIVNNHRIGHRRTPFEDWPEPDRKRHLVRLWLRDRGRRGYSG